MSDFSVSDLMRWGGPKRIAAARQLIRQGAVLAAQIEGPWVRGTILEGKKTFRPAFRIHGPDSLSAQCQCPEGRQGLLCAHALAAALALCDHPRQPAPPKPSTPHPPSPPRPSHSTHPQRPSSTHQTPSHSPDPLPPSSQPAPNPPQNLILHVEGSWREVTITPRPPSAPLPEDCRLELLRLGFTERAGIWRCLDMRAIARFYAGPFARWEARGLAIRGERLTRILKDVTLLRPSAQIAQASPGWLDFHLEFTDGAATVLSPDELRSLLAGGNPLITLKNGQRALADPDALEELDETLRLTSPRREHRTWCIPAIHAHTLADTARALGAACAEPPPPPGPPWQPGPLFDQLRPYQRQGVRWLAALWQAGRGGLLADEMGLGKTIQTLALLETLPGPSLVICPASLVWNWQSETRRFCPSLPCLPLTSSGRSEALRDLPSPCLVITSYGILRRDASPLATIPWQAIVLDEAQHIKNPRSQNARAARSLPARVRIALTGTPLENSLADVWSLFEFLLPGYLGPHKDFTETFQRPLQNPPATPVIAHQQHTLWERLRRRLRPFLLRRKKADLLPELPPLIEQILEVPLSPAQRTAYNQLRQAASAELEALFSQQKTSSHTAAPPSPQARLKILTALLRLRQCCCDLRLLRASTLRKSPACPTLPAPPATNPEASSEIDASVPPYPAHSAEEEGKLAALLDILSDAIPSGSRVLIFSQFTSMLDLIEQALAPRHWPWVRLDGTTQDRATPVRRFQSPDGPPIFLLSLKAGGAGLNLTAADTIIHYDPWWNPSVEAQATARAHRIGQQRVVTVIKLIAAQTIEARVQALQAQKRSMSHSFLDDEDATWQALSLEELAALLK